VKLYNTLSRSIEEFKPQKPPAVSLYVCGPTVYDIPHIGHARSAYTFDLLRRYLEFKKYKVTFVRNVTDVDDKIIDKARQEVGYGDLKAKCQEVAERYLKSYHDTLAQLGISSPNHEPKATEHVIPDPKNVEATKKIDASMTGFISQLITKNMAYPAGGNVYFSVRKFPNYGKLSNRTLDELQAGARVDPGEHKEDPLDFALWKAAKPDEPSWMSPWGPGRPGWHIECSVMSTAYLGDSFDIHGGGVDLVFPHHENEIAQAQALDKPFAKYWVHNGLLTVNGEKMSKSLKNYITVDEALREARFVPDVLKLFFLGAHYRSPIDYSQEAVRAAKKRFRNLFTYYCLGTNRESDSEIPSAVKEIENLKKEFQEAMNNDLNTPQALAVLDKLANQGHLWLIDIAREKPGESARVLKGKMWLASKTIEDLGKILGLSFTADERNEAGETVDMLFAEYKKARMQKKFIVSDEKRKELLQYGFTVQDTQIGSILIPTPDIQKQNA